MSYELWNGTNSNFQHLKVFGYTTYYYIAKEKRSKLEKRGVLVGYSLKSKGHIIPIANDKIVVSRSVVFKEDEFQ